jgi:hypothetical protein
VNIDLGLSSSVKNLEKQNMFDLIDQSKKLHSFQANDEEDLNSWIDYIQKTINPHLKKTLPTKKLNQPSSRSKNQKIQNSTTNNQKEFTTKSTSSNSTSSNSTSFNSTSNSNLSPKKKSFFDSNETQKRNSSSPLTSSSPSHFTANDNNTTISGSPSSATRIEEQPTKPNSPIDGSSPQISQSFNSPAESNSPNQIFSLDFTEKKEENPQIAEKNESIPQISTSLSPPSEKEEYISSSTNPPPNFNFFSISPLQKENSKNLANEKQTKRVIGFLCDCKNCNQKINNLLNSLKLSEDLVSFDPKKGVLNLSNLSHFDQIQSTFLSAGYIVE